VLEGHTQLWDCAVAPDGTWIVSASEDNTLRIWDAANGVVRQTLRGHNDWVRGCAVAPDGTWIVSASNDVTLRIWDVATGQPVGTG
jgi:WD40 repeat protein